jgi:tetratricopeptide (TPR) repeat protein
MENKQSWIRSLFGRKSATQANTPPHVPQSPSEAVPLSPENVPVSASSQPAPPNVSLAQKRRLEPGLPGTWKVGDFIDGRFDVTGILGEGGMGTVYKIYYRPWNMELAVKSPRPEIFVRGDGRENFIREAETWMNLRKHPHLVHCYFVLILSGIPRVFADYVDGGSLADWIRQRKLYEGGPERTLERMLDVTIQFAWGLHAAHEQGLVHQDIKPANVMLTSQGIAKVTDFGLAKARVMVGEQEIGEHHAYQSILMSSRGMTPAYCSPEQAAGEKLSRKTDIWSWGLSVLEMFTGEVTWRSGMTAQEVLASYQKQDPAIPVMPTAVMNVLKKCFQHGPEARPATMLEVATELQTIYARTVGRPYSRFMPKMTEIGVDSLANRGVSLRELGRPEEALVAYEQAIRLDPNHAKIYNNQGNVLHDLGRLEEALMAYEQAIRLDPNYANAYYNQGNVLQALGRPGEALMAYEQAIRLDPNYAKAYYNQGVVLHDLGRLKEALMAYEQTIRLDPNYADAYYNQGVVLYDLGRLEEALMAYEQAIRLDPNYADAYYNQGNVLHDLGRLKEAEQAAKKGRELSH